MNANYDQGIHPSELSPTPDDLLRDILDQLKIQNAPTAPADPPALIQLTPGISFAPQGHLRLRVSKFIISMSAADTVNIQIGTRVYPFYFGAGTASLDLEQRISEGGDIIINAVTTNLNIVSAYILAEPMEHKTQ